MKIRVGCSSIVLCISVVALPLSSSATPLEAFAGVVGGAGTASISGGCTTFSAPSPVGEFFGSAALQMQVLGGNAACGYSGGWTVPTASTGPLLNSASLAPVILGNPGFSGSFDGTAQTKADYGALGVSAHGNIAGGTPGSPVALFGSMGAAFFTDTLTASSPLIASLSSGFVKYQFSLDGNLSSLGVPAPFLFGQAWAQLNIQQDTGPIYQVATIQVRRGEVGTVNNSTTVPGWTAGTGSVSGSSIFESLMLPIVVGQPWDLKVGLMAWAYGTADADFINTARLIGVELFDARGIQVSDFTLTASSGTDYVGAAPGVVPEPTSISLMLAALGAAALVSTRRRRAQT